LHAGTIHLTAVLKGSLSMSCPWKFLLLVALLGPALPAVSAQEKSVKPGINDSFRDPDPTEFRGKFEVESREVFSRRQAIVAACAIEPGQTVADIGAGTGLFTRLFADAVGKEGRVIAVDIAQKFLDHIQATSREAGQRNVEIQLCKADSVELPADSIDVAFICDTYHHFEFPLKTMASLYRALKPGGRVILIDFRRVEGQSTEWVLSHVRAGQEVFEAEILQTGFKKVYEERELLKENYFVIFEKPVPANASTESRPGRGRGMGRGPGPEMRADQDVFHFLLDHHAEIRRSVKRLENGVETLTESDNKEVATKIQEHVASMHQRIKDGRGFRFWDELFVAIFQKHASINMTVDQTEKGVKVVETSDDKAAVILIQAHAEVVSQFVAHGFDEAHKNHPVPAAAPAAPKLEFPIIPKHGGVLPRPKAVEQPRAGVKIVFDATADAKPTDVNKSLERVARLLNLYGTAGRSHRDVTIAVVLHGEATKAVLNDAGYQARFQVAQNPNLPLIRELQQLGVEILVCGQALNAKGFRDDEVADQIPIAASAMTALANKQADGYSFLLIP
jgi:ubiquinone/menaquinone biosynthesis C-methylase UbiE/intracellular sulfur oxidation DsrE/DsrF family protein